MFTCVCHQQFATILPSFFVIADRNFPTIFSCFSLTGFFLFNGYTALLTSAMIVPQEREVKLRTFDDLLGTRTKFQNYFFRLQRPTILFPEKGYQVSVVQASAQSDTFRYAAPGSTRSKIYQEMLDNSELKYEVCSNTLLYISRKNPA